MAKLSIANYLQICKVLKVAQFNHVLYNFITRPRAEGDGVLRFNEPFALSTLPGVGGEVICNQIKTKQNYCMLKI